MRRGRWQRKALWAARGLVMAVAVLLTVFTLDTPLGVGLLIHLMPALLVVVALMVTWGRPLAAAVAFLALGAGATAFFGTHQHTLTFLLISGPPLLAGLLFLASSWLASFGSGR